jgi:hypothetical protein
METNMETYMEINRGPDMETDMEDTWSRKPIPVLTSMVWDEVDWVAW